MTPGIYRPQLEYEKNFTQIPNKWLRDSSLSLKAKGLLVYFMSHEIGYKLSFEQIVNETADGKTAIRSTVDELVKHGYLQTERTTTARGYNAGLVYILIDPSPKSENPTLENPTLENRTAYKEHNDIKENNSLKETTKRATRIPANFKPSEELLLWAAENHPDVDVVKATLNFVDYWETKPSDNTKLDWDRTWQRWIRSTRPEPKKRFFSSRESAEAERKARMAEWEENERRKLNEQD